MALMTDREENGGDASSSSPFPSHTTMQQQTDAHGGGLVTMAERLRQTDLGDENSEVIKASQVAVRLPSAVTGTTSASSYLAALEEMFSRAGGILSKRQEEEMVGTIFSVFAREESGGVQETMDEGDDEGSVDEEDVRRKTERLKGVFEMVVKLWWAKSGHFENVTEKLADGCRNPRWRLPMGESGLLKFYLEMSKFYPQEQSTKIQILRLVGNTCADTDENRARLVSSNFLPYLIVELHEDSLLPFAIPVLYNICIDYEPAQKQASECLLTKAFIDLISSPRVTQILSFVGYVCKLLDLMAAQESDKELAPEQTALALVRVASDQSFGVDLEDFLSLVTSAAHYLAIEKFQRGLIDNGGLAAALDILAQSYSRFDLQVLDADDTAALTQLRASLNQALSDISALPNFREIAVPPSSAVASTLRRWLVSPHLQLQISSCIILGNIARTDAICEEMVQQSQIHHQLISIITTANDPQLLHSALGFLKNLALPLANKPLLGEAGLFDALPRLWDMDVLQQVQFASISLARQAMQNTFPNVRLISRPLSKDPTSPASSRTKLSLLIALFDRADVDPIKMEISRLITTICRVWNSISDPSISDITPERLRQMRQPFFERHPDIGRPLAFMVSQSKWPVVRSEGWFVFALMARYPEGADRVSEVMHDPNVFQILVELMTGKSLLEYQSSVPPLQSNSQEVSSGATGSGSATLPDQGATQTLQQEALSPQQALLAQSDQQPQDQAQADQLRRIDRMNALVLLTELLKNKGDNMAVMRRAVFEDLVQQGGGIVSGYSDEERIGGAGEGGSNVVPIELATKGRDIGELAKQSTVDLM